jgi:SAM-dependent methyltransferase
LRRHARITEHLQTLTVFGRAQHRTFEGDSAVLARAILELLRAPKTRDELLSGLDPLFEGVRGRPELIEQVVAHLVVTAAVQQHVPSAATPKALAGARVLVAATGAVATAFTPMLVTQLQAAGAEVRVALTGSARRFVARRALVALTHYPVATSLWRGITHEPAPHIALGHWADLILVAPASATTLSRLARGDCSELVAATAISTRAPVVLAPSMNLAMLQAPSVRRNLEQLRDDGFHLVWPSSGIEVAEPPNSRAVQVGPMLPANELCAIVCALMPRRAVAASPDAAFWDARYTTAAAELPWHSSTLDPDLAAELEQGEGSLVDVGCGLGTVAIAATHLGYRVTGTDVSRLAVEAASKSAAHLAINFMTDDVLNSKLEGPFDVVVDRAVLHTLPPATHDRYLRQLARWTKPGARLLLKAHCNPEETRRLGTCCFDVASLTRLLAPEFVIERSLETSLPGALAPPPRALTIVARRT